jgi:RimJ/RimL family protein N-acetyltransferase
MRVIETERLFLRLLSADDAEFILELLNEPSFIRHIGDKAVRTIADAVLYIANGPVASYRQFGFGLYLVAVTATGIPIGICGLVKRDGLEDADIGYAFLQKFWSQGYAREAASAVMAHGLNVLRLDRILAITAPDNHGSIKVLERIGLHFKEMIRLPGYAEDRRLFTSEPPAAGPGGSPPGNSGSRETSQSR